MSTHGRPACRARERSRRRFSGPARGGRPLPGVLPRPLLAVPAGRPPARQLRHVVRSRLHQPVPERGQGAARAGPLRRIPVPVAPSLRLRGDLGRARAPAHAAARLRARRDRQPLRVHLGGLRRHRAGDLPLRHAVRAQPAGGRAGRPGVRLLQLPPLHDRQPPHLVLRDRVPVAVLLQALPAAWPRPGLVVGGEPGRGAGLFLVLRLPAAGRRPRRPRPGQPRRAAPARGRASPARGGRRRRRPHGGALLPLLPVPSHRPLRLAVAGGALRGVQQPRSPGPRERDAGQPDLSRRPPLRSP